MGTYTNLFIFNSNGLMKHFCIKVSVFVIVLMGIISILLTLPTTPAIKQSLLFAETQKDSLLLNEKSPRIIFVGGSNLSFGLNSQEIKDSLHLNPINTAIHAGVGLKYMLDHTFQYCQAGDIVVLVPEYSHFYADYDVGSEELLHTVLEVNTSNLKLLNANQILNCMPFIGKIILPKLKISEYFNVVENEIYGLNSFNEYGDVYTHWEKDNEPFAPYKQIDTLNYNPKVIAQIKVMEKKLSEKGVTLYVTFPSYSETSFLQSIGAVKKVEREYIKNDLLILGNAERYRIPDSLMFNTPYHCNKKGVDLRTSYLIEDLKYSFKNNTNT